MREKTFKVTYKNGNVGYHKAYFMELADGKLYICRKAYVGDQGVPAVINGDKILSVTEESNRVIDILDLTRMSMRDFCDRYKVDYDEMSSAWHGYRQMDEAVLDDLEQRVLLDIAENPMLKRYEN